ncbi:hypothetical protein PMAYCL1PPCAC_32994, partial [Pristionchus mayeri]
AVHFVHSRNESCPINYMRKIAIEESRTENVLLSDHIYSMQLHEGFRSQLKKCEQLRIVCVLRNDEKFTGALFSKSYALQISTEQLSIQKAAAKLGLSRETIRVGSPRMIRRILNVTSHESLEKIKLPSES